VDQVSSASRQDTLKDLVESFGEFSISSPTQMRNQLKPLESNSSTTKFSESASKPSGNRGPNLVRLPLGFKNTASVYQTSVSRLTLSTLDQEEEGYEEVPLTGAQQGTWLVLTATLEGKIVHWPGVRLLGDSSNPPRVVATMDLLPYQAGAAPLSSSPAPTARADATTAGRSLPRLTRSEKFFFLKDRRR
jgi:hypothetical protein